MYMKIELDDDLIDKAVLKNLKDSIDRVKQDIKNLRSNKIRHDYQLQDMLDGMEILVALEKVYDYYGGNLT